MEAPSKPPARVQDALVFAFDQAKRIDPYANYIPLPRGFKQTAIEVLPGRDPRTEMLADLFAWLNDDRDNQIPDYPGPGWNLPEGGAA